MVLSDRLVPAAASGLEKRPAVTHRGAIRRKAYACPAHARATPLVTFIGVPNIGVPKVRASSGLGSKTFTGATAAYGSSQATVNSHESPPPHL
jgi:hypothetical protein